MAAVIFSGSKVKALKQNLSLNSVVDILSGSVDPTVTATAANKGSLYLNDTTGLVYRKKDNGSSTNWEAVGGGAGGGETNLITLNSDFEANATTGWSLGNASVDATSKTLTGTPTFGSGASGNLSLAVESASPIDGLYSLNYVSSAATTAGNFVASDAFTVSPAYRAKPMKLKFKYQASSNPSNADWSGGLSNSFAIAIYDVTNSAWVPTSSTFNLVQSSGVGDAFAEFQTSATGASYRAIVYNANATSGAVTLRLDNFVFTDVAVVKGVPATDWQSFTPTASWVSNITWTGKVKRVGDTAKIKYYFILSNTTEANDLTINLPSGMVIDTAKLLTTDGGSWSLPGSFTAREAGVGQKHHGKPIYNNTTSFQIYFPTSTSSGNPIEGGAPVNDVRPFTWGAGDFFEGEVEIPVLGWSSNTVMSQDTATSIIAARAGKTSGAHTSSGNWEYVSSWDAATTNDLGAFDASTGTYTVKVTGQYPVSGILAFTANATGVRAVRIKKNSSTVYGGLELIPAAGAEASLPFNALIDCVAGDTIRVEAYQSSGGSLNYSTFGYNTLSISRLSGQATIAASENVSAIANTSSTSVAHAASGVFIASVKEKDTHGRYNASTGEFTCNTVGEMRVDAMMNFSASSNSVNGYMLLKLLKNGSYIRTIAARAFETTASVYSTLAGSGKADCIAGDVLKVEILNQSGSTKTANGDPNENWISFEKVSR